MSVRALTLEEWFTDFQLRALAKRHFHLPIDLAIDVTAIARAYAAIDRRPPFTAIVIKAAALLAARKPQVNRAVLRTPLGARLVQFEEAHVNVPVAIERDGRTVISAAVIKNADALSVDAIGARLREARERDLDALPIAKRLARSPNTITQRSLLRARHFLAYSIPPLYARHGGGISVSSLVRRAPEGVLARIPSYGPTAFTICPGALREESGRTTLHVGIGYDHVALGGKDAIACAEAFGALLAEGDPLCFGPRDAAPRARELPASNATP